MAGRETLLGNQLLDIGGKLQQTDQVENRRTIFARTLSHLLRCKSQLSPETVQGLSGLNGVQILPLDILDEGDLKHTIVRNILDDNGYVGYASQLCGAPSEAWLAGANFAIRRDCRGDG